MNTRVVDLSVVIPTCDRTELLRETVKSVLAQTVLPREIIVVDNGGTGHAADALQPFADRVRIIRSTPGEKQRARNAGIEAASGAWIATLDDDDLWRPDYLETAAQAMLDGRADIIASDHRKFRGHQAEQRTNFQEAPRGYWEAVTPRIGNEAWTFVGHFPLKLLLRRIPFYPSCMMVRRSLTLAVGGYDPRMRGILAEDIEYLARLLARGTVAILWQPLMDYRLHPGNTTASFKGQEIGRWRVFEFIRESHADLDAQFAAALDDDLPARRRRAFDLAYQIGDYRALQDAGRRLAPEDWSVSRRVRAGFASLPRPLAEAVRLLARAMWRALSRTGQRATPASR